MNHFGRKYRINPETLAYERVTLTRRQRFLYAISFGAGLIVLSIFLRNGFERSFNSPRQVMYLRENTQLRSEYISMDSTLENLESQLEELRLRDDRFYRAILSLDPVASTIREAGTGGSESYPNLSGLRDPGVIRDVSERIDQLQNKVRIQSSSLSSVYREAVNNQLFLACRPSINPISPADPFWMSSSFGYRLDPFSGIRSSHHGIDLAGPYGLDIHCAGDGVVEAVHMNRWGYGKEVIVDHGFGYKTRYAHLQDLFVETGQELKRGEVLGTLGSSGRSTGPHLHYEVLKNNHPVNPEYFFFEDLNSSEYNELVSKAN